MGNITDNDTGNQKMSSHEDTLYAVKRERQKAIPNFVIQIAFWSVPFLAVTGGCENVIPVQVFRRLQKGVEVMSSNKKIYLAIA